MIEFVQQVYKVCSAARPEFSRFLQIRGHELVNRNCKSLNLAVGIGLVWLAAGCSELEVEDCVLTPVNEAQAQRWTVGDTIDLPRFSASDSDCSDLQWRKTGQAPGSTNQVVEGELGFRFTPETVGSYRFEVFDGEEKTEYGTNFTVSALSEKSFHNYNYYPSPNALLSIGDEVWVAGVYSAEIARVNSTDGSALAQISVGPWPVALAHAESEGLVLVAQKANDRLGLVDITSKQLIDSIWVGDEPTNIAWDSTTKRAYIALGGANAVAIVDVPGRRLLTTIDAVFDPLALALAKNSNRLYVASHRSGQTIQYPYPDTSIEDEKDIAIIDLQSETVTGYILQVASTINHLSYDEASDSLWVSATSNDIEGGLNDPEVKSFQHELFVLEQTSGPAKRTTSVDLSRQDSSNGSAATLHGFTWCDGKLFVTAESSNAVVVLESKTLQELERFEDIDTPRSVLCLGSNVWVYSSNSMSLAHLQAGQLTTHPLTLTDLRSDELKKGYSVFHSAGVTVADNRSCASCHVKGMSDGVIWNAGPIRNQKLTRPLRWLEGTSRIGWDGYVGNVKISGYAGGATINLRPNTEQAFGLGIYLASLMPPPAANAWTQRDGSLSEQGLRGQSLFAGKASCLGCHPGPVSTSKIAFENGFTPGKTDVPSLIDLGRIGAWYKNGEKRTVEAAVAGALDYLNLDFTIDEQQDLTRYVKEITAREFFVLSANLEPSAMNVGFDRTFKITFSYPIDPAPENIQHVQLSDTAGNTIPATLSVDGRYLFIDPETMLEPDTAYQIEISDKFLSESGLAAKGEIIGIRTSKQPSLKLTGEYTWTVDAPSLDFETLSFDPSRTIPSSTLLFATEEKDGASVRLDFGQDLVYDDFFLIDGDQLRTKDLPIALGPSFGNGSGLEATLVDEDADGVADRAEGTLTLSGPGFDLQNVGFELVKKVATSTECKPGTRGAYTIAVESSTTSTTITWGDQPALGLYVTSPGANLPGGPGQVVTGGDVYFVLEAAGISGFQGPVTYGSAVMSSRDATEVHGGAMGGAPLVQGTCYQFAVFTTDFSLSYFTAKW